jgi:hypothetical protein
MDFVVPGVVSVVVSGGAEVASVAVSVEVSTVEVSVGTSEVLSEACGVETSVWETVVVSGKPGEVSISSSLIARL